MEQCYFEVQSPSGMRLATLEGDRLSIGRRQGNDIVISDPTVSEFHAIVERFALGWVLRDVGSTNGSFVNGERILGERHLRRDDEVRIGDSRLMFRSQDDTGGGTLAAAAAPHLTRRERDVLIALCRPMVGADVFTPPASTRDIADELVVSEAAVKAHLVNLYEKFGLYEAATDRRVRLAQEAVRRRAVTLADLRSGP